MPRWFAARASGTEDVYKIYEENIRADTHLKQIQEEAQALITKVLGSAS
jgi:phosphoglucomutase